MAGFERVFEQICAQADTSVEQGKLFESLMAEFFRKDPEYKQRFARVWLWKNWPKRQGPDTGIDLVAAEEGGYCAIQCKAFARDHTLHKSDIDSFFTASGKTPFTSRLIVSTAEKWSKHAEEALENQRIPVNRLNFQDLRDRPFDFLDLRAAEKLRYTGKLKTLRPHQEKAFRDVVEGFKNHDRGKLIMACGTGKTFISLKITEHMAGKGGLALFLTPSIALISQSMHEWAQELDALKSRFMVVCSDAQVGKSSEDIKLSELVYPPKTDPKELAKHLRKQPKDEMTVVFSTYQSLQVVSKAQQQSGVIFDIVICDEAHRTAGMKELDRHEKKVSFTDIHDENFIKVRKRLYMTATPRLYSERAKRMAKEKTEEFVLSSMDDDRIYGPEFHRLDFSQAIEKRLLSDYKVLILAVNKVEAANFMASPSGSVRELSKRELSDRELNLDDNAKLVGCWNALAKLDPDGENNFAHDPRPMNCAVAFANTIEASKKIKDKFSNLVKDYKDYLKQTGASYETDRECEVEHVDGSMGALERNKHLHWLREAGDDKPCRVLSNARCLSEGVDVPDLDGVMFMQPRASAVDIVQSVGRVMRKVKGKKYGYVVLPIAIYPEQTAEEVLDKKRNFRVVWEVLQALRSHDNRFNAIINRIDLNKTLPEQIQVIGVGFAESSDADESQSDKITQKIINFSIGELKENIKAHIVRHCGNRLYWDDWVSDISTIAQNNITRIRALLNRSNEDYRGLFDDFLGELRQNLNPQISEEEAIEMLTQHLVTKPVFNALFEGYDFMDKNPVSGAMEAMLDLLKEKQLDSEESKKLKKFNENVRMSVKGIDTLEGKQRILKELYEKFFAKAFKHDAQRLGIVFTPTAIVDFILQSADHLLRKNFNEGLSDEGVHILEPFVGTGTFMARLMHSEMALITDADFERKYDRELHANELVLLSYYIAAVNIEEAYHQRGKSKYKPFNGIVLTDTFQLRERDDIPFGQIFPKDYSEQVSRQKDIPIRVIVGNPPYSARQRSQNEDNKNLKYPILDARIEETYAKRSTAGLKSTLYDSYIRALRWATDRIGERGLIAFATNGSFINSRSADGLRLCLAEEFSQLYIYNLRGDARTSGEKRRREKDNVFGQGSRLPVTITLMLKDERHKGKAEIYYHDIGDYLHREEKLEAIRKAGHIGNLNWKKISPNAEGDWITKRKPKFLQYLPLGEAKTQKSKTGESVFRLFSCGVVTNRDAWAYNYDEEALEENMRRMIGFYESQIITTARNPEKIDRDPKKIKWTRSLERDLANGTGITCERRCIRTGMYRPFCKQQFYFSRRLNEVVYLQPQIFPQADSDNLAICVTVVGAKKEFSALMAGSVTDLNFLGGGQCFPRYRYVPAKEASGELELYAPQRELEGAEATLKVAENPKPAYERRDNINAKTVAVYQANYGNKNITADDIFYYVYGVLHSREYRRLYDYDLRIMLPRIPMAPDFRAFSEAGKKLAELHVNYETVEEYPLKENRSANVGKIEKMRFAGRGPISKRDKSSIICNHNLTLSGIPKETYDYQVNGKSAIEWIIDRYQIKIDKASAITNDPNTWSDNPDYIPSLLKRIVTLSLETVRIVNKLPKLD